MNAYDDKRNQILFYQYTQTDDDTASPVARSLQLIQ